MTRTVVVAHPAPTLAAGQRWPARATPQAVHLGSLVVAALLLVYIGRRQWFYFDEWTFLIPDGPSLLTPHGGHLTIWAELYYHGLRSVFGVHTYWPYLGTVYATHLLLAHQMWRVMLRSRVEPWVASALAFLFMLLGPGSENIFWGFQFCFIGPICCGVAIMLLVTRVQLGIAGCVGVAALTTLALGLSGTSLPFIAVAIVVSMRFRGLLTTVAMNVGPVVLYGIWFIFEPKGTQIATPGSLHTLLTSVPRYAGRMFAGGFDQVIPVSGAGAILLFCLAVWVGARSTVLGQREYVLPAALLAAGVVFAALTAYSRYGIGIAAAASGRYVYVIVAASLPALGAGASALTRGHVAPRVWAVVLIVTATAYDFGVLIDQANTQTTIEQGTRRQVYAALAYELAHPGLAFPTVAVDSKWAHALTPPQLLEMHQRGWIDVGSYRQVDLLNALNDIATLVQPLSDGPVCRGATSTANVSRPGENLIAKVAHSGLLTFEVLGRSGTRSRTRARFVNPGRRYEVLNRTGRQVAIVSSPPGTTFCPPS